jgi:hypothetical protein
VFVDVLMMMDFFLKFLRAFYDFDYHGQRHLRVTLREIARHVTTQPALLHLDCCGNSVVT